MMSTVHTILASTAVVLEVIISAFGARFETQLLGKLCGVEVMRAVGSRRELTGVLTVDIYDGLFT
ncbi:hypothetical protein FB390_4431 [Nocardia bhagyanarayanae]|uniref:Uncharacterized protein n=1 Tax=Nocardia bhagyanarayanae TaxID=1215925 RepID=A0A543FFU5_9NOCA|nr:hypothetical protein FB390_4431 [Nocardia bhagyanarayanae]